MNRIVVSIFLAALLVTGVSLSAMSADNSGSAPIGWPSANMQADHPVPLGVVKSVALKKAKSLWGQVIPDEPIPCTDQDGNLAYYMVTFKFGSGAFPSYDEIMQGVKNGRDLVDLVEKGNIPPELAAAAPQAAQPGNVILHENKDVPVAEKPQSAESETMSYKEAFKAAKKKEMGIGEYGTIFVAATYDRFPIPLYTNYLSPYYLTGDLAEQKAQELLGTEPTLNRIYFLGERGTYFEFVSGANTVTINAFTLSSEPIQHVERRTPTSQEQQNVGDAWSSATQ
jgi:hypothetical protein